MDVNRNWSGKKLLIVEDEEVNCFFFKTALKSTNAELIFSKDGRDGVEQALNQDDFDCVLMDIRLPILDGYEATKEIKAKKQSLPIIVQTAYAMKNEKEHAFECGCDDFLPKPIRLEDLLTTLDKYLNN